MSTDVDRIRRWHTERRPSWSWADIGILLRELDAANAIIRDLAAIDPYIPGSNAPYGCITCTWAETGTDIPLSDHEDWCPWRRARERTAGADSTQGSQQ